MALFGFRWGMVMGFHFIRESSWTWTTQLTHMSSPRFVRLKTLGLLRVGFFLWHEKPTWEQFYVMATVGFFFVKKRWFKVQGGVLQVFQAQKSEVGKWHFVGIWTEQYHVFWRIEIVFKALLETKMCDFFWWLGRLFSVSNRWNMKESYQRSVIVVK